MSDFQKRINRLISGNKGYDSFEIFSRINFICTKEFGWSYQDLMNTPIPYVLDIIDSWKKLKKEEKLAQKKARR